MPNPSPTPPAPRWYEVPADARPVTCRSAACGATMYFVATPYGTRVPVDCDVEGGRRPHPGSDPSQAGLFDDGQAPAQPGRGVSHYLTCLEPELFSRRGDRTPMPRGVPHA